MDASSTSPDASSKNCRICGADPATYESEVVRGSLCEACQKIEQGAWKKHGVGSIVIVLAWGVAKMMQHYGVRWAILPFVSPVLVSIWFLICLWWVSRLFAIRKKCSQMKCDTVRD